MAKKKKYSDKEKIFINNRHVEMFNKSLDGIDLILDGILNDLHSYDESFLELPRIENLLFGYINMCGP